MLRTHGHHYCVATAAHDRSTGIDRVEPCHRLWKTGTKPLGIVDVNLKNLEGCIYYTDYTLLHLIVYHFHIYNY